MTDEEITEIIGVFVATAGHVVCPHSAQLCIVLAAGLSHVIYPGIPGDGNDPKRHLFLNACGFHQVDEHGTPLVETSIPH